MIHDFIRKIFVIVVLSAVLIITGVLILVSYYNKENAKDSASDMLKMLEKEIVIYNGNYKEFVKVGDKDNTRITIIDLDGNVLADTLRDNIDVKPFVNHSDRKEIIQALNKEDIAYAYRLSASHDTKFLYTAKKIKVSENVIILRVALPIESINKYFISFIFMTIAVIAIVMILISALLPYIVKTFISPYSIIRENLDNILLGKRDIKKSITKFDEINVLLDEINILSNNLNTNNINTKKEQDKLTCLLENMREGIIALDKNRNIVFINNMAKSFLQVNSNNHKHIIEIVRNNDILEKIENAYSLREYINFDIVKDSNIIECVIFPVYASDIKILIKLNDVTDERKLAKEKQDFFTNASHELNTPLTSILGYSELLRNDKQNNKENNFIDKIYFEAGRMKDLVSDMLLLGRTDIGYQEEVVERIDLSYTVKEVIESLKVKAKNKSITILENLENGYIDADNKKIYQVVNNVIGNAIKYSREGGEVKVLVNTERDRVIFKVIDNGIGIPKEHLNRVFERFFRSNNVLGVSGTGLGLAIVKNISAHYNADISLKSNMGKSTEFTISFIKSISQYFI